MSQDNSFMTCEKCEKHRQCTAESIPSLVGAGNLTGYEIVFVCAECKKQL